MTHDCDTHGHRLLSEGRCAYCGPVEPGVWREADTNEYAYFYSGYIKGDNYKETPEGLRVWEPC